MGEEVPFRYRPDVLAALRDHGVTPSGATRPELVHEFVSDLYRYEIRELRKKRVAGVILKVEYIGHVIALRKKYWPLALTPEHWEQIVPKS